MVDPVSALCVDGRPYACDRWKVNYQCRLAGMNTLITTMQLPVSIVMSTLGQSVGCPPGYRQSPLVHVYVHSLV